MKYTYLLTALLFIAVMACKKEEDENTYVPQTPEADDAQIRAYAIDSLGLDEEGLIPLYNDDNDNIVYIYHIKEGIGDKVVNDTTNIEVHYTGYYIPGGDNFETTQPGQPRVFNLANNISGWKTGLKEMSRTGKAHLFIPSREAYSNGNRHFTVTLEGFTLITDERDDYEHSLIKDYFSSNEGPSRELVSDTANIYIERIPDMPGTGISPEPNDSVKFSYTSINIVTGVEKHSNADAQFILEELSDGFSLGLREMKEGETAYLYVPSKRNTTAVDVLQYMVTLNEVVESED